LSIFSPLPLACVLHTLENGWQLWMTP